jgi:hypothetical protein
MKEPEPKRENSELEKILTAVEGLQTTVTGLNERVSTQEQVGVLYEISARQEVARRFGQYHCDPL